MLTFIKDNTTYKQVGCWQYKIYICKAVSNKYGLMEVLKNDFIVVINDFINHDANDLIVLFRGNEKQCNDYCENIFFESRFQEVKWK